MATRKRDTLSQLDQENILPTGNSRKRACTSDTLAKIVQSSQAHKYATRGMHVPSECPDVDRSNLRKTIHTNFQQVQQGTILLEQLIPQNTEFSIQKAFVLLCFGNLLVAGKGIMEASEVVGLCTGYSAYTVRKWASDYFCDFLTHEQTSELDSQLILLELSSDRGRHPKHDSLIHDSEFQIKAREYVRANSYKRGEPNLTAEMFGTWVRSTFGADICVETSRVWLHRLGFSQRNHKKGVFFDGHDRPDVVKHREQFITQMNDCDGKSMRPGNMTPEVQEGDRPLVRVYHDESTFYSNALQSQFWSDESMQPLRQKSLGTSIMISDFIEEVDGFLQHNGHYARVCTETSKDGYWNNDKFMAQVKLAIDIFESKYRNAQGVFLYDNAPSHRKFAPDALNASAMNVSDGGKQAKLRDTVWNGVRQEMVYPDGTQKGLKTVLKERGVDTSKMNAVKMREVLGQFNDFATQKCIVEEYTVGRGHLCVFLPPYHCELNPIERVWCHCKQYTRSHNNGTIVRLRKIIPESFATVTKVLIAKYFVTVHDYER